MQIVTLLFGTLTYLYIMKQELFPLLKFLNIFTIQKTLVWLYFMYTLDFRKDNHGTEDFNRNQIL